jgi:hypothetical protein
VVIAIGGERILMDVRDQGTREGKAALFGSNAYLAVCQYTSMHGLTSRQSRIFNKRQHPTQFSQREPLYSTSSEWRSARDNVP